MDEHQKEMQTLGIVLTIGMWGTIGVILLLNVVKNVVAGSLVEPLIVGGLIAAIVTVLGVLLGDTPRRIVGGLWLLVAAIGFLSFVVGAGLEVEWLLDKSFGMLFGGLISAYLIFIPDRE